MTLTPLATARRDRLDVTVLTGARPEVAPHFLILPVEDEFARQAYLRLRHEVFVAEQGLFAGSDRDDVDDDPRSVVLVAVDRDRQVMGGVRLGPLTSDRDLGWWAGSRLVVAPSARRSGGVGPALVRAACAYAESHSVLRFDASVQLTNEALFTRLGWRRIRETTVAGAPHVLMRWPIDRVERLVSATKASLAGLLAPLQQDPGNLGGAGFVGDDGAPVPGTDLVAACDAIVPSMVERDPEWAGWCAVLVNVNDLSAMGAEPIGLLNAVGARDASFASRILRGLREGAQAWGVPVLGGHTQLGVPAALSVTALGRAARPVPGSGGQVGHELRVTADLGGEWRPSYRGQQWDSTSTRSPGELRQLANWVARTAPAAAKDVSMAGLVGTTGMLAEASGCGAVLDIATIPTPGAANAGDWLTCFPGFAMITADRPGQHIADPGPATSAVCGELTSGSGVSLRWPDDELTRAVSGPVTGLIPPTK